MTKRKEDKDMENRQAKKVVRAPFYVWLKRHVCPDCGAPLRRVHVTRTVADRPLNARESGFQTTDSYRVNPVEYVWTEFRCLMCGRDFTVEKIRQAEREAHVARRAGHLKAR